MCGGVVLLQTVLTVSLVPPVSASATGSLVRSPVPLVTSEEESDTTPGN